MDCGSYSPLCNRRRIARDQGRRHRRWLCLDRRIHICRNDRINEIQSAAKLLFLHRQEQNSNVAGGRNHRSAKFHANLIPPDRIVPRNVQNPVAFHELLHDIFPYNLFPDWWSQLIIQETYSTNPEIDYKEIYRGVTHETQLDFEHCAVQCGLGELGLHGTLLTDDFGPLQRYCFILTDAKIEASPLIKSHLCDHCGKCVSACPGKAIADDGALDLWQCAAYYKGANMSRNPFMPPEAFADDPDKLAIIAGEAKLTPERAREVLDQIIFYPPIKHGYVSSICGKACDMACYIHLEEKGVLNKQFLTPFRKREEWRLPVST
eukprot:TRINITY_DN14117_c0_g1_i2.p1 TRINITY_DN14117_c0_g1~~TRINITY_DN14117_c0_g1_i2.p1  ORF type:complete len:320 (+),score=32.41 TRINITY_DN14117_c0_g1_i2:786-1745(+)